LLRYLQKKSNDITDRDRVRGDDCSELLQPAIPRRVETKNSLNEPFPLWEIASLHSAPIFLALREFDRQVEEWSAYTLFDHLPGFRVASEQFSVQARNISFGCYRRRI
jgi:hypothetical protein